MDVAPKRRLRSSRNPVGHRHRRTLRALRGEQYAIAAPIASRMLDWAESIRAAPDGNPFQAKGFIEDENAIRIHAHVHSTGAGMAGPTCVLEGFLPGRVSHCERGRC